MNAKLTAYAILMALMTLVCGAWALKSGFFKHKRTVLDAISADIDAHDKPLGASDTRPVPGTRPSPKASPVARPADDGAQPVPGGVGAAIKKIREQNARANKQLEDALNQ